MKFETLFIILIKLLLVTVIFTGQNWRSITLTKLRQIPGGIENAKESRLKKTGGIMNANQQP